MGGKKGETNDPVDDDIADTDDDEDALISSEDFEDLRSTTISSEADIDVETDESRDAWLDVVSEIVDEEGGIDERVADEASR